MKQISSSTHPLVKHLVRLQSDRSYRHTAKKVVVEGKNLLLDLLPRHKPVQLIMTEKQLPTFEKFGGEIVLISDQIASKISSVEEPEGCFAEYALPEYPFPNVKTALVLDGLQDPGNVGTLLRTCLAFDVRTVFLIEPCCDPWNPKTIRAAKGAQFDLALCSCTFEQLPPSIPLFVADLQGTDLRTVAPPSSWILVLGNEAHGHHVPQSLHPTHLTIPMSGPMESLNVAQAGAIFLYALTPTSQRLPLSDTKNFLIDTVS